MKNSVAILLSIVVFGCTKSAVSNEFVNSTVSQSTPTTNSSTSPLKFIDFNFKDIRLGDDENEVLKKLGKPSRRQTTKVDNCGIEEVPVLHYPDAEIQLERDQAGKYYVLEIHVSGSDAALEPGIRIGDSYKEIKDKFGEPDTQDQEKEEMLVYYLTRDDDNALLVFRNDKLIRVRLYINPC